MLAGSVMLYACVLANVLLKNNPLTSYDLSYLGSSLYWFDVFCGFVGVAIDPWTRCLRVLDWKMT